MSKGHIYIALGGNIGDVRASFLSAIAEIDASIGAVIAVSSLYTTAALFLPGTLAAQDQAPYSNAVISCASDLNPEATLKRLLEIEQHLGRRRESEQRWGPRTIDLDLLAIDSELRNGATLTIPHPELHRRDFVLYPLQEIEPDWIHPGTKKSIARLIEEFEQSDWQRTIISCRKFT